MTVTTTANAISYAGNGVTTAFAFPYIFFAPSDLQVTLIVTATSVAIVPAPVLNGAATYDYTVSGDISGGGEYASGATVTFNTAPLATHTVSLVRYVPPTQLVTLIDNTKFPAATINNEFDKLTVLAQQNSAVVGSNPIGPAGGMLAGVYPNPTIAPGSNGQVLTSVGGVALWAAPATTVLQTVSFQTGAVATGTTILPGDDTIPQITEGNEYMTLAITPKSATSKLVIEVTAYLGSNSLVGGTMAAALFQDTTANALACSFVTFGTTSATVALFSFKHTMTSGTTSPTTFRVRGGFAAAGTTTFNGFGGARLYGGVAASSIVILEVAP